MQVAQEEVVIDDGGDDNLSDTTEMNLSNDQLEPPNQPPVTKRQKLMAKKKEDAMVADAYSYLKSVKNTKPDEASIFGDLIAEKLSRLPMSVRPVAQHAVLSTLLDYELGNTPDH